MTKFEDIGRVRHETVDGIGPWRWLISDEGAWYGPKIDWEDSHKEAFLTALKGRKTLAVQAGGCQGMYPRLLSDIFDRVITFEPDPINFHFLVANCQRENIVKVNGALGDSRGWIWLQRGGDSNVGTHTTRKEATTGTLQVPVFTVDDMKLPACDLLCLDIEGFEIHAMRGAIETIREFRPVITAENGGGEEIATFLQPFDYIPVGMSRADTIWAPRGPWENLTR
jgi:FkbM family methyltransferase